MSFISTHLLKNSTIMLLYSEREEIKLDPEYQRMGGVWTKEKKQLLIDSILNDYDIPKIYFHVYQRGSVESKQYNYAVIDGRQRLETIWGFINGKFNLSEDFEYQRDKSIKLSGLSYDDMSQEYPKIKIQFDSFVLPVIGVETDDDDLIEDMFSRLNEAVPLNAAEKRNAIGGNLVATIREISNHHLFEEKVCFSNSRYQHREISARFLLVEENLQNGGKLIDTKKVYLDALAKNYKSDQKEKVEGLRQSVQKVLSEMDQVFSESDPLLRAQGNMVIYYLLIRHALLQGEAGKVTRRKLLDFQDSLKSNREMAEENYEESSFTLLEYDRLTQQGTNDASNIKERLSILVNFLGIGDGET